MYAGYQEPDPEDKVAQMYSAIQTGGQLGMQTLDQCLKQLLQANTITKEAAQEKAKMPDDFNDRFDKLLKVVVEQGASDLFITAGLPPSIK